MHEVVIIQLIFIIQPVCNEFSVTNIFVSYTIIKAGRIIGKLDKTPNKCISNIDFKTFAEKYPRSMTSNYGELLWIS